MATATTSDFNVADGFENSFRHELEVPFLKKYRVYLFMLGFSLFVGLAFITANLDLASYEEDDLDMSIDFDMGDLTPQQVSRGRQVVEVDEVFGNQFVKDKQKVVAAVSSDSQVLAGATNPIIANYTMPIDLSPQRVPKYTTAARNAGVEGAVTLMIVVSETGKVLMAKPVGKRLGYGLDRAAAVAFRRKRYKPSLDKNGTPKKAKFLKRVRFQLN